jgi:hypothetical protein
MRSRGDRYEAFLKKSSTFLGSFRRPIAGIWFVVATIAQIRGDNEWPRASQNPRVGSRKAAMSPKKPHDETKLRELGESMLKDGQLQDVIAQPDGSLIFGHVLMAGRR